MYKLFNMIKVEGVSSPTLLLSTAFSVTPWTWRRSFWVPGLSSTEARSSYQNPIYG